MPRLAREQQEKHRRDGGMRAMWITGFQDCRAEYARRCQFQRSDFALNQNQTQAAQYEG